ncbi:hypothetical protein [Desulfosporosinus fructosivorans]
MSKIFSVVELEANTGIQENRLMGGIPDREGVESSDFYQELMEDCGDSKYVSIKVASYSYGDGESENASEEDLNWIKSQPNFINSDEVTPLQDADFIILYPDQGQQFM